MSQARNITPISGPVIPDKLYFRIGEVARLLSVETHTLRFWESEFPHLRVGKGGTGQRLYRRKDVEFLLEIKHLLYELGYTIPGARQKIASRTRRTDLDDPPKAGISRPEDRLGQIRAELRDLSALLGSGPRSDLRETGQQAQRRLSKGVKESTNISSKKGPPAIHLAPDSTRRIGTQAIEYGPGLFDAKPIH